jgi:hypothetical protein
LTALARRPWAVGALSGILGLLAYLFGPPAADAAAHLYLTQMWRDHGWRLWDNFWYAGRYSQVNYSMLFYPLAALVGVAAALTASVAAASAVFAVLVRRQWPRLATGPVVAFALLVPLGVTAGTYPFLMGLALALGALAALQAGRVWLTLVMVLLTALAHPLALLFLLIVLAGLAASSRGWWRDRRMIWLAVGLVGVAVGQILLLRAFNGDGRYPFDWTDALAIAVFCGAGFLLTQGLADQRPLRALFAGYAALAAVLFVVSSPIGGNMVRLMLIMGTPLLLLPLAARGFRPRAVSAVCLAAILWWQALPAVADWRTVDAKRASSEAFWYPVMAFLDRHENPNYRVEVVATADHWEAYYLARRGVPLARGWFRQDDFPENAPLYRSTLTPQRYLAWMRRMAVRYVMLPDDPLDYSAQAEAKLLRTRSPLAVKARYAGWTIYELSGATPIATPAAGISVRSLTSDAIVLRVLRPGRYHLRLRYTPYWRVVKGRACASPRQPWGTELRVTRPGLVRMRFSVSLGRVVGAVLGDDGGCGAAPPARSQKA